MNSSDLNSFYIFKIPTTKKDIIKTCYENRETIIDYLLNKNMFITAIEKIHNSILSSKVVATFLPKRFDIIIKNGYAYFYLKEEK
jgi:hypothetical protein